MPNIFAQQLKQLRKERHYSMQKLADLAHVSKSMISKIEQGEVQPTLDTASRLANAFGKSLSAMLDTAVAANVYKLKPSEQSLWEDPATHLLRRTLSPPFPDSKIEWLDVCMPPHTKIQLTALTKGYEKYFLVIEGNLALEIAGEAHEFNPGDSGYFAAHFTHAFVNRSGDQARYFLIIKVP